MNLAKNRIQSICMTCLLTMSLFFYGSVPTSSATSFFSSVSMPAETGAAIQKMEPCIVSYPKSQTTKQPDGSYRKQQIFTNRRAKNILPTALQSGLQGASLGFYKLNGTFVSLSGSALLSTPGVNSEKLSTIINTFDVLMNSISKSPNFVEFFRKIHLNILNELYEYLMNIYANFNLQHPGSTSTNGVVSVDVTAYLQAEEKYSTNIKTLIVNHLVNLIEEQFSGAVTALMPSVPQLFATKVGKTTIYADYSVDLTNFILQDISSDLQSLRSTYLNALNAYLSFFQNYTALISVADDATGFNQFCSVAENIDSILTTTDMATMLTKMNPPMFFYNNDTMRALRLIPALAKKIPTTTQSIGWPTSLVTAATNKTMVTLSGTSHPIAYFTDANGKVVTSEAQAINLYACIQSGAELVQEKILKQPDWLNTEEGIIKILRACMGDFTALLDMGILDCCMESIINNALNITSESGGKIATTCQTLLNSYTPINQPASPTTTPTAPAPGILSAPTSILSPTTTKVISAPTIPNLPTV